MFYRHRNKQQSTGTQQPTTKQQLPSPSCFWLQSSGSTSRSAAIEKKAPRFCTITRQRQRHWRLARPNDTRHQTTSFRVNGYVCSPSQVKLIFSTQIQTPPTPALARMDSFSFCICLSRKSTTNKCRMNFRRRSNRGLRQQQFRIILN